LEESHKLYSNLIPDTMVRPEYSDRASGVSLTHQIKSRGVSPETIKNHDNSVWEQTKEKLQALKSL
jgi:hypothetical protein